MSNFKRIFLILSIIIFSLCCFLTGRNVQIKNNKAQLSCFDTITEFNVNIKNPCKPKQSLTIVETVYSQKIYVVCRCQETFSVIDDSIVLIPEDIIKNDEEIIIDDLDKLLDEGITQ